MFGMSMAEMTVVAIIALVILGPEKLPEVARMAGRGLRELRKASNMFRDMLLMEEAQQEAKKRVAKRMAEEAERERLAAGASSASTPPTTAPSAAAHGAVTRDRASGEESFDWMGPLDGPEDELPQMKPQTTRTASMNPPMTPAHVRKVEVGARKREVSEAAAALLSAESWREVHLHTQTGELWR
jgi:Tat protein translocase TatB subunit